MEIELNVQLPFGLDKPLGFMEIFKRKKDPQTGNYCTSFQYRRRLKSILICILKS